ncbi:MAG: hypothetical protein IJS01_04355 [Lentisphaeria bacterium]|nr:hypothetical protein [Lentisphaeria bacterium]
MKICAIQPPYGYDLEQAGKAVDFLVNALESCDGSVDLVVTPEYSDTPGSLTPEEIGKYSGPWGKRLETAAVAAAKRCHALVALSFRAETTGGVRNTTRLFLPSGECAGEYWKQQLVLSEPRGHLVDDSYALRPRTPTVVEAEGLRFAFVTCYDAYFLEYIERLASCRPDIVLVCAMQRGETHDNLLLLNRMLAFRTDAFVVRASYSMGKTPGLGGTSLVVDPAGKVLADMGDSAGKLFCEIADPKWKYMRSNSFGGDLIRDDLFVEQGRTPWAYRPCGPFVKLDDRRMPYPRVCAHRGFHVTLPENSLPALGAAVAMGADEIEFDLWETADGVPVSIHDPTLDRVSDGSGTVREKTFAELRALDFGVKAHPSLKGLKIVTLEEILRQFARQTVMNIHIKSVEGEFFSRPFIRKIADLLRRYDCADHAYFMGDSSVQEAAIEAAPGIARCMAAESDMAELKIVERAVRWGCQKVQFFKPYFDQALIDEAHRHGIRCNLFWSDDSEEALGVLKMGIDTILTNNYWQIARVRDRYLGEEGK